jgi:hypothetical protein
MSCFQRHCRETVLFNLLFSTQCSSLWRDYRPLTHGIQKCILGIIFFMRFFMIFNDVIRNKSEILAESKGNSV